MSASPFDYHAAGNAVPRAIAALVDQLRRSGAHVFVVAVAPGDDRPSSLPTCDAPSIEADQSANIGAFLTLAQSGALTGRSIGAARVIDLHAMYLAWSPRSEPVSLNAFSRYLRRAGVQRKRCRYLNGRSMLGPHVVALFRIRPQGEMFPVWLGREIAMLEQDHTALRSRAKR